MNAIDRSYAHFCCQYMDKVILLEHYLLYMWFFENIYQFLPFISAYFYPNCYFVFLYRRPARFICRIFLQLCISINITNDKLFWFLTKFVCTHYSYTKNMVLKYLNFGNIIFTLKISIFSSWIKSLLTHTLLFPPSYSISFHISHIVFYWKGDSKRIHYLNIFWRR